MDRSGSGFLEVVNREERPIPAPYDLPAVPKGSPSAHPTPLDYLHSAPSRLQPAIRFPCLWLQRAFGIGNPEAIMDAFANARNGPSGDKRCLWK